MCTHTEVHVIDIADQTTTEIGRPLTGINGSEDESIDIPASILRDQNSTGMYALLLNVYMYIGIAMV